MSVLVFFVMIKYKETPIMIYKIVHTGPKTQFGGLKKGLAKSAYHVGIDDVVNTDPIAPADKQMTIERASRK